MAILKVIHHWSDEFGQCSECGNPAAFHVQDEPCAPMDVSGYNKRCAVCAANAACLKEPVHRIDGEYF